MRLWGEIERSGRSSVTLTATSSSNGHGLPRSGVRRGIPPDVGNPGYEPAFPYALRVANFMAVSDAPIVFDAQRWRSVLTDYRIDGRPVFELERDEHRARLEAVLALADTTDLPPGFQGLQSREGVPERFAQGSIITDDNMLSEWRDALKRRGLQRRSQEERRRRRPGAAGREATRRVPGGTPRAGAPASPDRPRR